MTGLTVIEKYIQEANLVKKNLLPFWESVRGAIYIVMIVVVTYVLAIVDYKKVVCIPSGNKTASNPEVSFANEFCFLKITDVYRYFGMTVGAVVVSAIILDKWWLSVPCVRNSFTAVDSKVGSAKVVLSHKDLPYDRCTTICYWIRSLLLFGALLFAIIELALHLSKDNLPKSHFDCTLEVNTQISSSKQFHCIYAARDNVMICVIILLVLISFSLAMCVVEVTALFYSCCKCKKKSRCNECLKQTAGCCFCEHTCCTKIEHGPKCKQDDKLQGKESKDVTDTTSNEVDKCINNDKKCCKQIKLPCCNKVVYQCCNECRCCNKCNPMFSYYKHSDAKQLAKLKVENEETKTSSPADPVKSEDDPDPGKQNPASAYRGKSDPNSPSTLGRLAVKMRTMNTPQSSSSVDLALNGGDTGNNNPSHEKTPLLKPDKKTQHCYV